MSNQSRRPRRGASGVWLGVGVGVIAAESI
jgi:hypothetical protein